RADAARVGRLELRGRRPRARRAGRHRALAIASCPRSTARPAGRIREDLIVSDDFDPLRRLRPDRVEPDDPGDPAVFSRAKERFMSAIDEEHAPAAVVSTPDIYPRLAYRDELAAVDYLTRVVQLVENREARMEYDGKYLCWLRAGTGVVMLGHANPDIHMIHSPLEAGLTTVMIQVYVHDIDAHYAHAVDE